MNRLLEQATEVGSTLQQLKNILARGYQSPYEFVERNAAWVGIDMKEFRTPKEIESIIANEERRLSAVLLICGRSGQHLCIFRRTQAFVSAGILS